MTQRVYKRDSHKKTLTIKMRVLANAIIESKGFNKNVLANYLIKINNLLRIDKTSKIWLLNLGSNQGHTD